jgi:hypothetical protein
VSTPEEFAAECRQAALGLRRVDKDLRRELSGQVKEKVAEPLAKRVGSAARGPWSRVLQAGTKARAGADPKIVVGGLRPRLSGGAGPRQVVFGTEFGGGKRLTAVPASARRRGYRRYSTNQFRSNKAPFVFPTIGKNIDWVLDTFADITLTILDKEVNRG